MTSRSVRAITLHVEVNNVWSLPVSEIRIWVEVSTVDIPLLSLVTRRMERTVESSATSQALRSVMTRQVLFRRMRFRFCDFCSSLETERASSSSRYSVVELLCVVDVLAGEFDVRREERVCDL